MDAIQITEDLYLGVKIALDAQSDTDFDEAARHFAIGLSKFVRDVGLLGASFAASKAAGKAAPHVKDLLKAIKDKGLQPMLRGARQDLLGGSVRSGSTNREPYG